MSQADLAAMSDQSEQADLRSLMAAFPTGVTIVTATDAAGRPIGMTCTSVCSVSLRPPILLVCLRSGSPTLEAVLSSGAFSLNLLRHDARATAELFASGAPDRFARTDWCDPDGPGGPHLHNASHTVADCVLTRSEVIGDHEVVYGQLRDITEWAPPEPLMYGMRSYSTWQKV